MLSPWAEQSWIERKYFLYNPKVFSDCDFMIAEILQLESTVVQDHADSISESTSAGAVDFVSSLTATIEIERNIHIPNTSTFCPISYEPAIASLSYFNIPTTSKNLPGVTKFYSDVQGSYCCQDKTRKEKL